MDIAQSKFYKNRKIKLEMCNNQKILLYNKEIDS